MDAKGSLSLLFTLEEKDNIYPIYIDNRKLTPRISDFRRDFKGL